MWVRDQNRLYLCKGQKVKHTEVLIHKACSATWLAAVSLSDTPLKHLSILALNLTSSSPPCPRNTNSNYHLLYTNRHMSDGMESYLLPCCNYIHYNGGKWIYTHRGSELWGSVAIKGHGTELTLSCIEHLFMKLPNLSKKHEETDAWVYGLEGCIKERHYVQWISWINQPSGYSLSFLLTEVHTGKAWGHLTAALALITG